MRVRLADGRVVNVDTNDPEKAARAAHQFQLRERQRSTPQYQAARAGAERRSSEDDALGIGRATAPLRDFTTQIFRNLGVNDELSGAAAYLGQAAQNAFHPRTTRDLIAGSRRPAPAEAAQAAMDLDRERGAQYAREHPNRNIAAIVASIPAAGGTPAGGGPISAWRAGLGAAATDAPFALARQDGSLQERLPGAARETAVAGLFGAGLQAVANRLVPRLPPRALDRADQFERAGVRPTLAAVSGGPAATGLTRMISENFLAGGGVRRALQGSLDDTSNAASRIARSIGTPEPREQVGEAVQRGVQRWARERMPPPRPGAPETISTREWSAASKANALYEHVFNDIAHDEAGHIAGMTGATATADNARRVLAEINNSVTAPNVRELVASPLLRNVEQALATDQHVLRFNDLRRLRTYVREAGRDPGLSQGIDNAQLQRLEQALTQDITQSAAELGGPAVAHRLRRADQYYRAMQGRIQRALEPYAQGGGVQAYRRIIDLASQGGRENSRLLSATAHSVRSDEWRVVGASIADELGSPSFGHPEVLEPGAFSVERFVTNYARLSPEGRRILFGQAAPELDNLARVAGYQKQIEAMANRSRSGINAQNAGSFMGLANPATMAPTAGVLAAGAVTGEMLTNPAFVRWLVSAQRGGGVGGMRRQLAALAQLAARDPALVPYYDALAQQLGASVRDPASRSAPSPQPAMSTQ